MPTNNFAVALRGLREKSGLTQWEFSRKAGISRGLLSLIETGGRTPPLDKIERIADALELSHIKRRELLELAYLAHAPEEVSRIVEELRLQFAKQRQQHALLLQEVSRLRVKNTQNPRG